MKTVFIACYKGTETDDILGVFSKLENAQNAIRKDYENTEFGYTADYEEIHDSYIFIQKKGEWYDEWYIFEAELQD